MITHRNIASNAKALHAYWGFVPGDVLLHALPIFHVHGLFVALHTALLNASRILWLPKFELAEVMRLLPRATVLMGVPTFYTRLLGEPAVRHATQCRNLRLAISGSAPLLAETHEEFTRPHRPGHPRALRHDRSRHDHLQPLPRASACRHRRLCAARGLGAHRRRRRAACCRPARSACWRCKGPNVFKGYWRNPEKTKEEFRKDGYFMTGDLANMGKDGRVTIVGRAKDLIITGGFNVYPKEVEGEINSLPGVGESAVVGVPHPDFGEGIIAVVTALPGGTPPSEAEIIELARAAPRQIQAAQARVPAPRSCPATPWARCRRLCSAPSIADCSAHEPAQAYTGASGWCGPSGSSMRTLSPGRTSPPFSTVAMTPALRTRLPLASRSSVAAISPGWS